MVNILGPLLVAVFLAMAPATLLVGHVVSNSACPSSCPASLNPLLSDLKALAQKHLEDPQKKIPVVGIGGCPGVGKTTLAMQLKNALEHQGISCALVRFDDWTNPPAKAGKEGYFNFSGIHAFFQALAAGQLVLEKPLLDEFTQTHLKQVVDFQKIDLILFEGLFALTRQIGLNYFQYCDGGVFVKAMKENIAEWKKNRPTQESRTEKEWAEHLETVFNAYDRFIAPYEYLASWTIFKNGNHGYTLQHNTAQSPLKDRSLKNYSRANRRTSASKSVS